jgi:hypothetical protein
LGPSAPTNRPIHASNAATSLLSRGSPRAGERGRRVGERGVEQVFHRRAKQLLLGGEVDKVRRVRQSDPPADLSLQPGGAPASPGALSVKLKLGAVAAVAIGFVVAQRMGLFEIFGEPARIKQALVELGPWGYVAFVAAYAALQPFGVPGTVFILAAPLIWPWPVAFALSMTGTMAASVVGFSFARFVARDWVSKSGTGGGPGPQDG